MNPFQGIIKHLRDKPPITRERLGKFGAMRLVSYATIALSLFGVGAAMAFVYRHVFESIATVQTVLLLKNDLEAEVIDFDRLERVRSAWEKRQATADLAIPRDPFVPAPPTTTKK